MTCAQPVNDSPSTRALAAMNGLRIGLIRRMVWCLPSLLSARRTELRGERGKRIKIEVVETRRVAGEQLLQFIGGRVVEQLSQVLARVRERTLIVRIIAPPHEAIDTDDVARTRIVGAGLT